MWSWRQPGPVSKAPEAASSASKLGPGNERLRKTLLQMEALATELALSEDKHNIHAPRV